MRVAKEYIRLVYFFTGLFIAFYAVCSSSAYLIFESVLIALLFPINVIIEKIFDEYQRFIMFEKKYVKWGLFALSFYIFPVLITIIIYEIIDVNYVTTFVIFSLVVNLGILAFILAELRLFRLLSRFNLASLIKNIQVSLLVYFSRFNYLLANLAVGHILIITRYGVLLKDPMILPVYVLFMQCGGIISSLVDMLYLAFRREKFVRSSAAVFDSLKDEELIGILVFGVLGSSLVCLVISRYERKEERKKRKKPAKKCLRTYADSVARDHPAHPRSLI